MGLGAWNKSYDTADDVMTIIVIVKYKVTCYKLRVIWY